MILKSQFCLAFAFCAIVFFTSGSNLSAQSGSHADKVQFVSESWGVRDGLPVGHVNEMYQTPDGFIWMVTFNGLVRFDGVTFTRYDVGNTPGLPSNRIIRIQAGLDGSFWLFTEQRSLVNYRDGKFTAYGPLIGIENQRVILDGDSVTWVTSIKGLLRFDGDGFELYNFGKDPHPIITSFLRRSDGTAMVTDINGNLYSTNYPYNELNKIPIPDIGEYSEQLKSDPTGKYWASINYFIELTGNSYRTVKNNELIGSGWSTMPPLYFALNCDQNGNLYILAETGFYKIHQHQIQTIQKAKDYGIPFDAAVRLGAGMCVAPDGSIWTVIDTSVYRNGKLQFSLNTPGNTIFFDRENSIWITNKAQGVQRFSKAILSHYLSNNKPANYYGVYQDRKGVIWFGAWSKNLFYMTGDRKIHEVKNTSNLGVTAAFAEDPGGSFYVGYSRLNNKESSDEGIGDRFEKIEGVDNEVFAIHYSPDSSIWYGTLHGLSRLRNGVLSKVHDFDSIPDFPVRFILETPGKNLWLATNGSGIRLYNYETNTNHYFLKSDGLSSNNIRGLLQDDEGNIWAATEDNGLSCINPGTGEIKSITKQDGLYSESLNSIILDNFGRLWISANDGIFWVRFSDLRAFMKGDLKQVVSTVYTERDGMLNRETNGGFQNAAMKSTDGLLWFVTQEGLISIDPSEIMATLPLPPVVIEAFSIDGESIVIQDSTVYLDRNEQNFRIKFTVPSFWAPNRIRFKYMLQGFDTKWVHAGHGREAIYTNIPKGNYTFKVAAYYNQNTANVTPTSLTVIKEPKVLETIWFWLCLAVLVAILIYGIFRWRLHQMHLQKNLLAKEVKERTRELESEKQITEMQKEKLQLLDHEKNRFFANISHEFRTPLSLIIGPLKDLLNDRDPGIADLAHRQKINLILKNAQRLLRLVEQLLDIAKLEAGEFHLDLNAGAINNYVSEIADSFIGLAETKNIRFRVQIPESKIHCRFDPRYLDKIIVNLLSNAFKFTPHGGQITMVVQQIDHSVKIAVSDTGIGIEPEEMPRLFDRFYQIEKSELQPGTGIGLSIAREMAELHGGKISAESEKGVGSTFTLSLPCIDKEDVLLAMPSGSNKDRHEPELAESLPGQKVQSTAYTENGSDLDPDDCTTILIVDDNADIRHYVVDSMNKKYIILTAESGNEAFEIIKNRLPDVIISDVMMPGGDGLTLLRMIRENENFSFLPVILLTAKAEIEAKLEGLKIGADDYITKPFDVNELKARIESILEARQRLKKHFILKPEAEVFSKIQIQHIEAESQDVGFIRKATQITQDNFTDEAFTIEDMAARLGQSRSNLYRKLIALTGESPSVMLKRIRLEHAAMLLSENAGTVSEIAYASGFNSVAHFSKSFSSFYGMSPTAYASR